MECQLNKTNIFEYVLYKHYVVHARWCEVEVSIRYQAYLVKNFLFTWNLLGLTDIEKLAVIKKPGWSNIVILHGHQPNTTKQAKKSQSLNTTPRLNQSDQQYGQPYIIENAGLIFKINIVLMDKL